MHYNLSTLILTLLLIGCASTGTVDEQNDFVVLTPGGYAEGFADSLKIILPDGFILDGNRIISGSDTMSFPAEPQRGKRYLFSGFRQDTSYALSIDRINYSSIKYILLVSATGWTIAEQKGEADLLPSFILGSETIVAISGNGYLADAYYSPKWDSSQVVIKLGSNNEGLLIATVEGNKLPIPTMYLQK